MNRDQVKGRMKEASGTIQEKAGKATGNRSQAWQFSKEAVRANWKEPRTAIALAAMTGAVKVENVLSALHKRGRGI